MIHQYKLGGYNVVLDICSGSVHVVDDVAYDVIALYETKNLCQSAKNGGCGECQTSCQSACKTSCGIANQQCESNKK